MKILKHHSVQSFSCSWKRIVQWLCHLSASFLLFNQSRVNLHKLLLPETSRCVGIHVCSLLLFLNRMIFLHCRSIDNDITVLFVMSVHVGIVAGVSSMRFTENFVA